MDRAALVDLQIAESWPDLDEVALVAVGGYGRRELFPYSDIDLLILTRREDLQEHLAPFIRGLWDSGLRVSQSVHTPEECFIVDDRNAELSVSLLDRRYLAGDLSLFELLGDPPREQLVPELTRLARERHARYSNTVYHLEPNVKESPGTLRDLQVLRWLARLESTDQEVPPHELLFRLRTMLHLSAGRDQNVLNFEMQDACANELNYASSADLMRDYYREALPIYRACLRRIDFAEPRTGKLFGAFQRLSARLSSSEFQAKGGAIQVRTYPDDPPMDAASAMRLFEFKARHGLPLARDVEDRVAQIQIAHASWDELRRILEQPHAAGAVRSMHDTGFLVKLFPELQGLESLVIRDFYHRYTVDEHTLVTIEVAEKLRSETEGLFAEVSRETQEYPLLLLALLFHDAGKGVPSDNHAEASVAIASRALATLGLNEADSATVLFLIRCHLDMSRLMLTRDLADPSTAAALARIVGTIERLRLLTLLTYCDISAVNPAALTPWRSTLLWLLYLATARYLTRALQTEIAEEGMPARYALTHSPEEIAEHHRMEKEGRIAKLERTGDTFRLTVGTHDRPYLFAHVAGTLASFGMNILRAEAFVNDRDFAINAFTFVDPMRTLELNPTEFQRLATLVEDVVQGRRNVEDLLRGRPSPRRAGGVEPYIASDNTATTRATLFEITAGDRPGLLFDLARYFSDAGCNIEVVLVDTQGRKAIDVFYVTRNGRQLDDAATQDLRERLTQLAA